MGPVETEAKVAFSASAWPASCVAGSPAFFSTGPPFPLTFLPAPGCSQKPFLLPWTSLARLSSSWALAFLASSLAVQAMSLLLPGSLSLLQPLPPSFVCLGFTQAASWLFSLTAPSLGRSTLELGGGDS